MVRKILFTSVFILALGFFSYAHAAERIKLFDSSININSDASLSVTEKIVYDFGTTPHHGIFRTIPIAYNSRGMDRGLIVSIISVTDERGKSYPFAVSAGGNAEIVKIGDPNVLISGAKAYVISYSVKGAINYFSSNDELYWNVTGNSWNVPLSPVSAKVDVQGMSSGGLKATCFEGPYGAVAPCTSIATSSNGAVFMQNALAPNEGITIVVGFPKGLVVVQPPISVSGAETSSNTPLNYWPFILPVLSFAITFWIWRKTGRDPKGRATIVPEYDAPDDLRPAEVGTLFSEKADNRAISATIIDLAVRGYLKITRTTEKKIFFDSHDYLLEKLKPETDLENEFEKKLMQTLFTKTFVPSLPRLISDAVEKGASAVLGTTTERNAMYLSDLKNSFVADAQLVQDAMYTSLVAKGYFKESPKTMRAAYRGAGAVIIFFVIFFLRFVPFLHDSSIMFVSLLLSGIIPIVFSFFISERTQKGVEAKQYIVGFKQYLSVVEADRIKFANAPEKNPERFEKLLPYAMVLGVEKEWAKQFEGIYTQPPNWYGGYVAGAAFYPSGFVSDLNTFSSSATSTFSTAAGGGSGFSGGGSGGGFGGGGGGSW